MSEDVIITEATSLTNDHRGKKVLEFKKGNDLFEVFEDGKDPAYAFVGYCNGERSVSGSRADVAARALQIKHLKGLPEGKLIDFKAAVAKLAERKT